MHFCFIDESGTPPKPDSKKSNPYFVIGGVIMHESQWHGIAAEVRQLCARPEYNISGEIKWRYFGPQNTDPSNSVSHLSQEAKDRFRRDYFNIIIKRKSVKIVACVASVVAAYRLTIVEDAEALYHYTYKPVSERFQYHLQDLSRTVGNTQLGIVVGDHRGRKQDENFRLNHLDMIEVENAYVSNYDNFVECIFLTPSHMSIGVQIADMVSGAIGRAFNQNDSTFFEVIKPSFRKKDDGSINGFGLVKFPKNGWE
ncbi:DUF3800 domain-containing protein [Pseudohoeflea coraliihabitans]|uniref:DUF3800 domain-containing protein n=1 Tax=Pseudohoeflea coraliihabitans TaxID=2860393 RepID=A0ABS6WUP8_9HYPH|nr:DUF3800 domain-containing protein [Pseudohoeflea sp. DP4N28-3]MBW3099162.1 DUF3800 domain-containing protein [Pseudohoeflea sp. DP4N28-3]